MVKQFSPNLTFPLLFPRSLLCQQKVLTNSSKKERRDECDKVKVRLDIYHVINENEKIREKYNNRAI